MSNRYLPIPGGTSPDQQLAIINKNFAELDNQAATSSFLIVKIVTFNITQAATTSSSYIKPHNLGFAPALIGYLAAGDGNYILPTRITLNFDTTDNLVQFRSYVEVKADNTNVTLNFWNASASTNGPYTFKVYCLQESSS